MGFIRNAFKKLEERKALRELVPATVKKYDSWINTYSNDGLPPTVSECATLEDEKVEALLEEFDGKAKEFERVADEVPKHRATLQKNLKTRKGCLFYKFSDRVGELKHQATRTMRQCMEQLEQSVKELTSILPVQERLITLEFHELVKGCEEYVTASYPGGVAGLDAYDDILPDDLPSYDRFLELVKEKEEEFKAANKAAIAPAVDQVKADAHKMFRTVINRAIEKAMEDIEEDLSDDVLPYLSKGQMMLLRAELIGASREYGESRLDRS